MVCTRSKRIGLLYAKGKRLEDRLRKRGLIKGPTSVTIELRNTGQKTLPLKPERNDPGGFPWGIAFVRTVDGIQETCFLCCIHAYGKCVVCKYAEPVNMKDDEEFVKVRMEIGNRLWNSDPFVCQDDNEF